MFKHKCKFTHRLYIQSYMWRAISIPRLGSSETTTLFRRSRRLCGNGAAGGDSSISQMFPPDETSFCSVSSSLTTRVNDVHSLFGEVQPREEPILVTQVCSTDCCFCVCFRKVRVVAECSGSGETVRALCL